MTKTASRAAIYTRISNDREGTELGVTRQLEDCRRLAKARDLTVVDHYSDNDIGASTRSRAKRRPEYARMLADIESGRVDALVAYSQSRLTRRPAELEVIIDLAERHGLRVFTVANGDPDLNRADGRAVVRTVAAWDTAEAERIAERVSRAAEQRAENGGYSGGRRRFGYEQLDRDHKGRPTGPPSLVPIEAAAIADAYRRISDGGTLASVVRDWNERGLTGPSGAPFDHRSVKQVLLRPGNGGLTFYRGREAGVSTVPAIVDTETWRTVRAMLTDPTRNPGKGRPAHALLTPFMRCGTCGGRITGLQRPSGSRPPKYICRTATHVARSMTGIDDHVSLAVLKLLSALDTSRLAAPLDVGEPSTVMAEGERLRRKMDRLEIDIANAKSEREEASLKKALRLTVALLADSDRRIVQATGRRATATLMSGDDIDRDWARLSVDQRREVVAELVERITISPVARRGRVFTAEGIDIEWQSWLTT